jgi:hypothetical protein
MGTINFEFDDDPFEMVLQGTPEATPDHEAVVVTLPVYVPGQPQRPARVRVPLSMQFGQHLLGQLERALMKARRNSQAPESE